MVALTLPESLGSGRWETEINHVFSQGHLADKNSSKFVEATEDFYTCLWKSQKRGHRIFCFFVGRKIGQAILEP